MCIICTQPDAHAEMQLSVQLKTFPFTGLYYTIIVL